MRLAVISNLYPPYIVGGYELACSDVVDGLRTRGHDVRILTSRHGVKNASRNEDVWRELDLELGVGFNPVATLRQRLRGRWFTLHNFNVTREFIRDYQPDAIYIWNLLFAAPLAILLGAALSDRPTVAHLMDYWLPQTYNLNPPAYVRRLRRTKILLGRALNRWVNLKAVIVMSDTLRQEHIASGFPAERFTTIHHGIKLADIRPRSSVDHPGPVRLLYAGQVLSAKGMHILIDALAILRLDRTMTDFSLDVIGTGPADYRASLEEQVRARGLADIVRFVGYVPREELLSRYADYDVFVFPTHALEPGGIVVMEAMAAGLAVVTSDAGGPSEVISSGHDGILAAPNPVDLAIALRPVIEDEGLRRGLQQNARATAEQTLSIEHSLDAVERVLREASNRPDQVY